MRSCGQSMAYTSSTPKMEPDAPTIGYGATWESASESSAPPSPAMKYMVMNCRPPICASTRGPKKPNEIMLKIRWLQLAWTNMYVTNVHGMARMYAQCG